MTEKCYIVTVEKTIRTKFKVWGKSPAAVRRKINEYGPDLAAMDYANSDDEITTRIKSVTPEIQVVQDSQAK